MYLRDLFSFPLVFCLNDKLRVDSTSTDYLQISASDQRWSCEDTVRDRHLGMYKILCVTGTLVCTLSSVQGILLNFSGERNETKDILWAEI